MLSDPEIQTQVLQAMCPKDFVSLFVFSQDQTVIFFFSLSYSLFIFSCCTNISKQCLFPIQEISFSRSQGLPQGQWFGQ